MKASDPVRLYAEEKVAKLHKILDGDRCEAHVVISVVKLQQSAHFELIIAGAHRVRAEERSESIYSSIDAAVDKLVKQVKRYREKMRDTHRADPAATKSWEVNYQVIELPKREDDAGAEVFDQHQIVRTQVMEAKEMNVDDAVIQMDLLNSDFLVFTNRNSRRMNFMYRLPDGQYGLIEATTIS